MNFKITMSAIAVGLICISSCSENNESSLDNNRILQVRSSIGINDKNNKMDFGEKEHIGVTLYNENGLFYHGEESYSNMHYISKIATDWRGNKFTAWTGDNPTILGKENGKVVGFYPYMEGVDLKSIPIETASQTDYMCSDWATGISSENPKVQLVFHHLLCALKISFIRGSYKGKGFINKISISSPDLAKSAEVNILTRTMSGFTGSYEEITNNQTILLSTTKEPVVILAIPIGKVSVCSFNFSMDGKEYHIPFIPDVQITSGGMYEIEITVDDVDNVFNITSAKVSSWEFKKTSSVRNKD